MDAEAFSGVSEETIVRDILENLSCDCEKPRFFYSHINIPGHFPDKTQIEATGLGYQEKRWSKRVRLANKLIFEFIQNVPDIDNSIVVLLSDHGPHFYSHIIPPEKLQDFPLSILDEYGTLCAVRWPADYTPVLKDLHCSQNIMLEILIYLTGDTSLSRFERSGLIGKIYRSPYAAVVDRSMLLVGPFAGKNLFDAARNQAKEAVSHYP